VEFRDAICLVDFAQPKAMDVAVVPGQRIEVVCRPSTD
jgi:hypothetical protein